MFRDFKVKYIVSSFCIIILMVIISYSLPFINKNFLAKYIIGLTSAILVLYIISYFLICRFTLFFQKIVLALCIIYFLLELSVYFCLTFGVLRTDLKFFFNGIAATNTKFAQYDSITGFKGIPGKFRYMSIDNGILEIDHYTTINKKGWFSEREYSYRKSKRTIKRFIVLGDSYSSGLAVGKAWPDLVQDLLIKNRNDSVELYNFSLEGIGLVNWYRIFFREIVPNYEFDGVIIASSSERSDHPDLDRNFFMANSFKDATYLQVAEIQGHSSPSFFQKEKGFPAISIYTDEKLNSIKETYVQKRAELKISYKQPDLWFLSIFYGLTEGVRKALTISKHASAYNKPYEPYYQLVDKPYKMEYFDSRYKYGFMLKEIINYCSKNKKEVILMCIPDVENGKDYIKSKNVMCVKEIRFLSKTFDVKFFNGFEIFQGRDESFVDSSFYKYDRHWNKYGVKKFAEKIIQSKILNDNQ